MERTTTSAPQHDALDPFLLPDAVATSRDVELLSNRGRSPALSSQTNVSFVFAKPAYESDDKVDFDVFGSGRGGVLRERPFDTGRFFFELVTQLLHPLSIPFVIWHQNVAAAVNKGFLPGAGPVFYFECISTLAMWVPLAFASYAASADVAHYWGLYAVSVSFSLAIFLKLVIAGKYACYSSSVYARLLEPNAHVVNDLLILSWYSTVTDAFLEALISDAEATSRISLAGQYFVLADGRTRLSARAYLDKLVRRSFKEAPRSAYRLVTFATIGLMFLPIWLFVGVETSKGSPEGIIALVLTLIQSFYFGRIVYGFLAVGVLHYWRFMRMHFFHGKALGLAGSDNDSRNCMTIPASIPSNLVVWTSVRTVIKNFARVHTNRISFNFFANVILCGFFVLILLQQLLSPRKQYPLIAILAYNFFVVAVGMITAILMAVRTNRSGAIMIKLLQDEKFAFMWRRYHPGIACNTSAPYGLVQWKGQSQGVRGLSSEEEFNSVLDVVKETLQQGNDLDPVVVMFVPASPELLSFILSMFISGMTLILGVVSSTIPGIGS